MIMTFCFIDLFILLVNQEYVLRDLKAKHIPKLNIRRCSRVINFKVLSSAGEHFEVVPGDILDLHRPR